MKNPLNQAALAALAVFAVSEPAQADNKWALYADCNDSRVSDASTASPGASVFGMKGPIQLALGRFGTSCIHGTVEGSRIGNQYLGIDLYRFESFQFWATSGDALWVDRVSWVTQTPDYSGVHGAFVSRDTAWGSDGGKGWCVSTDFSDTFSSSVTDEPCWPCWEFVVSGSKAIPCRSQLVVGESIRLYSMKHGRLLQMNSDGTLGSTAVVETAVTDRRGMKVREAKAGAVSVYSDANLFRVVSAGFGQVALYNDKYKRFVRMSDKPAMDSTAVADGNLPEGWTWERFVALDDRWDYVATSLYSKSHGRYIRMTDSGAIDPSYSSGVPLRSDWTWERFYVIPK